jgi:magnesium-transporting ATPase (P-type)
VRKLVFVPWAAVAATMTAVALAGTPVALPVTVTAWLVFGAIALPESRVPRTRTGESELKRPLLLLKGVLV